MITINNIQPNPVEVPPLVYGRINLTCPCCSRAVDSKTNLISFDWGRGQVFKGGMQVQLTPMEADLLKILLDSWPETVSKKKILLGLYGGNYRDKVFSDNAGVLMVRLRQKLKTFDIGVQNINRRGWWLVKQSTELRLNLRNREPL